MGTARTWLRPGLYSADFVEMCVFEIQAWRPGALQEREAQLWSTTGVSAWGAIVAVVLIFRGRRAAVALLSTPLL